MEQAKRDNRGFMVSTEIVTSGIFHRKKVIVTITDGQHEAVFVDTGTFTVLTDIPYEKPVIKVDPWNPQR